MNGFARRLVLTQRQKVTRKWLIVVRVEFQFSFVTVKMCTVFSVQHTAVSRKVIWNVINTLLLTLTLSNLLLLLSLSARKHMSMESRVQISLKC